MEIMLILLSICLSVMTCIYEHIPTNRMALRIYRLSPLLSCHHLAQHIGLENDLLALFRKTKDRRLAGLKPEMTKECLPIFIKLSCFGMVFYWIIATIQTSPPPTIPLPPLSRRCDLISLHSPLFPTPPVLSHLHLTKVHNTA
jgi:hypothetical protein